MFRRRTRRLQHSFAVPDHRQRGVWMSRPPLAPRTVVVLAVLAAITLTAAMLAGSVKAEDEADQEKHAAACPDANPVREDVATGDLETDLFETSTNRFVISYARLDLEKGDRMTPSFATIQDEQGRDVSSGKIPDPHPGRPLMAHLKPNEGRYVVNAAPGSYQIRIDPGAWDKRYALTVEECGVPEVS